MGRENNFTEFYAQIVKVKIGWSVSSLKTVKTIDFFPAGDTFTPTPLFYPYFTSVCLFIGTLTYSLTNICRRHATKSGTWVSSKETIRDRL